MSPRDDRAKARALLAEQRDAVVKEPRSKRSREESGANTAQEDERGAKRVKHDRASEFTQSDDIPLFSEEVVRDALPQSPKASEGQDPQSPDSAIGISPPQARTFAKAGHDSGNFETYHTAQCHGIDGAFTPDSSSPSAQHESTIPSDGPMRMFKDNNAAASNWDLPLTGYLKLTAMEIAAFLPNLWHNHTIVNRFFNNRVSPRTFRLMVLEHHTNHRTAQTDDWNTIIKDDDDFCDLKALAQGFVEVMSKGPEPAKAAPEYRENPGLLNFHQPPPGWDPKNITPVGYQDVREAHHGLGQGTPDIPFTELLRGVTKIPTGDDAADLTRAIAWAAAAELRSGKVYMFPKDLPEVIAQAGVAKRNAFRADGEVVARFKRHYVEVYKLNPDRPTTRRELWPGFADKEKRSCYDAAPHEHKWKVEHAEIVQKAADLLPVEARHIFYTIHKPDPWLHPDTEHLNTGKPHPYSDFISDTPIDAHVDDADFIAVVMSTRAKATKEGTPTGGPPAPTNHRWSYGDYNPLLIERLRQRSGATQKKEPEQAETAPDDGKGSDTEEDDSMAIEHEQKMQKEREEKQKKKREEQRMMPPPKLPARARARRVAQTTGGKQVQKRIYRVAKQPSAAKQIPKSSATRKARPAWDIPPLFLADPKRYREITKDFPSERAETDLGWPKGLGDWTVPASTSWTKVKQLAWELEKEATGGQPTWTDQLWLSPF